MSETRRLSNSELVAQAQAEAHRRAAAVGEQLAEELELLVDDVTDAKVSKLEASVVKRLREVGEQVEAKINQVIRREQEDAAEAWQPSSHYAFGQSVSHAGGTWCVAARRGTKPGERPGPDSAAWLMVSNGITDVLVEQRDPKSAMLVIRMADGAEFSHALSLPSLTLRGLWDPSTVYHFLDVVVKDGGSFVAKHTTSGGSYPGPAWQLLSARSKTGSATKAPLKAAIEELTTTGDPRSRSERLRAHAERILAEEQARHPDRFKVRSEYQSYATRVAAQMVHYAAYEVHGRVVDDVPAVKDAITGLAMIVYMPFAQHDDNSKSIGQARRVPQQACRRALLSASGRIAAAPLACGLRPQ